MCEMKSSETEELTRNGHAEKSKWFERLEMYLAFGWEVLVLVLTTIGVYIEFIYRLFFPVPLKSLHKEIILVTGSANGIGREVSIKLASTGAKLILWDIDKERNEKLLEDLKFLGTSAYAYEIDIADRAAVEVLAKRVEREVGEVTMVINNAGIMPCHEFLYHNPREIERTFQVNVFSHFWILRQFLPGMIKRNKGHIVTVASAAGMIPTRNLVPYCASKHAVCGFVDSLKEELRHHPLQPTNIRFTTVYPFSCKTRLIENIKCSSRFPTIFPIVEPTLVASRLIEGIQRNYENVYIPSTIQWVGIMAKSMLPKAVAAGTDFFECHVTPESYD